MAVTRVVCMLLSAAAAAEEAAAADGPPAVSLAGLFGETALVDVVCGAPLACPHPALPYAVPSFSLSARAAALSVEPCGDTIECESR